MRKDTFEVGAFVHVYNRGNRKQPIVRDQKDRWRFIQALYYFNNKTAIANPFQALRKNRGLRVDLKHHFTWPGTWPLRQPIVKILAFCLMENHFHLLLKEIEEGGITLFMKKFGNGITAYFNAKYQETGRLFQGSYKARRVEEESYLKYLSVYIQVKNPFEMYPGGIQKAVKEFDNAYAWTMRYPYCSLADYAGKRNSFILDKDVLEEMISTPEEYQEFARQCLAEIDLNAKLGPIKID